MGKVSIIMPVYNTAEFIDKSVQSLIRQTYTDLEIILINDGSNESCTRKLTEIAAMDNRIKLYHLQGNKGTGAARNVGMDRATGDFIYFFDSDDYLPEKTIEILMRHIKHHDLIRGKMKTTYFGSGMAIILDGLFKVKMHTEEKYHLFKNESVLNCLFRTEFVQRHQLRFMEDARIYSDLSFIVMALMNTQQVPYVKEAVYFKRKRNDAISNPSLDQSAAAEKVENYIHVYTHLKKQVADDVYATDEADQEWVMSEKAQANHFLDRHFLNFYRKTIVTYFKDEANVEPLFERLSDAFQLLDRDILQDYSWILKNEAKPLLMRNKSKYVSVNRRHKEMRQFKQALKTKKKFYIYLYQRFFVKRKTNEKLVFFESFLGKNYSDSPKYIYEYMLKKHPDYTFVWSFNEKKQILGNAKQVIRFSLRYFYYLAKAKYWVSNSRLPRYLNKPDGNIFLQTWHGTPLKHLVFDMDDVHSADPKYKAHFYEQSRRWDYLSSPNRYSSDIFRRAFKYDGDMLEFGYPRNDILYQKNTTEDIQQLKEKMGLPHDKKVILYAPTWRDDEFYSRGKYKFTLQMDLHRMQEELGRDYIIVLRMHYFIASVLDISEFEGFAYDFSSYDDIAELYLVSDMLITDYSSVFFDYANLKRPIMFFMYDLEKYRDQLRGFYIDVENEVPGPIVRTTEEIVASVKNLPEIAQAYQEKYDTFYERFCKWDDGNAAAKTVEAVFK
ncbi:bifunctional glycosyltransferase family 2 protein/CDP-glycerol:glycerophosphate glycerophosphotransferase [Virgibacillus sp. 179-BFC.A HS]|uniref:Bifunctional glycosyltransferase family 2 protein/CDP-glycerol:glycerophosphate glycerophosphotransferase n=1 Tax=Tigheibacillus jepli TaxID=3035914 RepID=A0ABU5CEB8_9BACI|nr:bifunctional glycosyltransferase family 2 protein/CDP-glycerol:glycerophosphate glycerophosphotransferase [Virgibacillus sp. 179-BFC.A HS]MDY0404626.1 bifunctional glycosyltransferase family 2 protein/CDP-glycerol:glycerophosphate glycerophosphotransferase [Virgibacillus sp. 179-BFC.A HS]